MLFIIIIIIIIIMRITTEPFFFCMYVPALSLSLSLVSHEYDLILSFVLLCDFM